MKKHLGLGFIIVFTFSNISCRGQSINENQVRSTNSNLIGGGCDGCEIMYIGMPKNIQSVDTSAGWRETGQKLLLTGTIYKSDGRTRAPNVIVYYWQTDNKGYYSPSATLDKNAKRHGHIRGWIKSDNSGKYSLYTIRPAPYPNESIPAHIHTSIKEPDVKNEYYIDEFVFDDDPFLTTKKRKALENRGGSGILRVDQVKNLQIAEHDIILGLNIPNYLYQSVSLKSSGLKIGEESPSFMPSHAWGPDKGSRACPVCKYGKYYGIIYFVGNHPQWDQIETWLVFLEKESIRLDKQLKIYFVYGNDQDYNSKLRTKKLAGIGEKLNLKYTALTFVPSFSNMESEVNLNKINPNVRNTFIVYKNRIIIDKFVDLEVSERNFKKLFEKIK